MRRRALHEILSNERHSVADLVRRMDRSEFDDLSLRRLRQKVLASADAMLKDPVPPWIRRSKVVAAFGVPLVFASALVLWPGVENARSEMKSTASFEVAAVMPTIAAAPHGAARADEPGTVREPPAATPTGSSPPAAVAAEVESPRLQPPARRRRTVPSSSVAGAVTAPGTEGERGPAAEDTAYLEILSLLDEGRRAEASVAAQAYLARFPHGFRRPEVRAVALSR